MLYTTYYTLRGISRHLRISTKGMNYQNLIAGLDRDKFATFWMLPKNFYHSLVLQMTFIHFTSGWTQVDLSDFEKKNMKACETVKHNKMLSSFYLLSYFHENSDEHKIRRKIFFKTSETFQCYNWSGYYKIPEFRVGAKLSKYWSDVIDLVKFLLWDFLLARV